MATLKKSILKQLIAAGFEHDRATKHTIRYRHPKTGMTVQVGKTTSDSKRAYKNMAAAIKKAMQDV